MDSSVSRERRNLFPARVPSHFNWPLPRAMELDWSVSPSAQPNFAVKLKVTLVQTLRLCTGRTNRRWSRRIALLLLHQDTRNGEGSASRPGRSLPQERHSTYCTWGWVGPRAGLDRCGKSSPPRGFDPRTIQPIASHYIDWATRPNFSEFYQNFRYFVLSSLFVGHFWIQQQTNRPRYCWCFSCKFMADSSCFRKHRRR